MFYQRIKTIFKINLFSSFISKMSTESINLDAKRIFQAAVTAVKPENLIDNTVVVHSDSLNIKGQSFPIKKNVHIVGFGKAVLGMAVALENKLKENLLGGILSIPEGTIKPKLIKQGINYKEDSSIKVYEGAANNVPDYNSMLAASEISNYVSSLTESDLLLVLISGGGSALLPAPKRPLTLEEKQKVIKTLASRGATIEELNAIRKRLSDLKGGELAQLAKPATVISLILSDIIGDSLNIIASGPTVENTDDPNLPLAVVEKYNLLSELPNSALQLLQESPNVQKETKCFSHVHNFIIGNNHIALEAAAEMSMQLKYHPIIMTKELRGIASYVGNEMISLVRAALNERTDHFDIICNELKLITSSRQDLWDSIKDLKEGTPLSILFGGETTVEVNGSGVGGRNQELALSAAISLSLEKTGNTIVLLSAGTDGIDGPTTAAGAIATPFILEMAKNEGLEPADYLRNNDSFNFYSSLKNGQYLVQTGHTGTNVMDIIIILIK